MSRIIRTVSLSPQADEIAAKKSNFSAWVRNKLLEENSKVEYRHITPEIFLQKGICNPSSKIRCGLCYPYGKPMNEDVRLYNTGHINKETLQDRTKNHYGGVIEITETKIQENEPSAPPMRERKYLRRALKYIWSFI